MVVNNFRLAFRPLLAGTMISSSEVRRGGTIACFATSDGFDAWALTAAHVISAIRAPFVHVGQPDFADPHDGISKAGSAIRYATSPMDVAAFEVAAGIAHGHDVLELGSWTGVDAPISGRSVIKAGCTSGITRGRIGAVRPTAFDVHIEPGMPDGYLAFGPGDSGAAWLDPLTNRVVGIHTERAVQGNFGVATRMDAVLADLGLALALP